MTTIKIDPGPRPEALGSRRGPPAGRAAGHDILHEFARRATSITQSDEESRAPRKPSISASGLVGNVAIW